MKTFGKLKRNRKAVTKIETIIIVALIIAVILSASSVYYVMSLQSQLDAVSENTEDLSGDLSDLSEDVGGLSDVTAEILDILGAPVYQCDICGAVFATAEALAEHIATRHEPPIGGTLSLPLSYDPPSMNPFIGQTASEWYVYEIVYEPLLAIAEDWTTIPWLAHTVDVSEDGLIMTFHLVENATWHDGEPFTSNDVKFTFEYALEKEVPTWAAILENLDKIEVPDDYTVDFYFKNASATFYNDMAATFIVPEHIWKDVEDPNTYENPNPVGMGPFKFSKWVRGQYIELEANEDYWAGRPYIDKVIFRVISTYDATVFAFATGEIDAMGIQALDVPTYLGKEGVRLYQYSIANTIYMAFNMRMAPMNDTQFRYAVAHAIDKDKINEIANAGFGFIWEHFWPEPFAAGGWINPDITTYEYNVTKAMELLDDAGYIDIDADGWREAPDGSEMSFDLLTGAGMLAYFRPAQVIAENLQDIGLDVSLEALEVGTWVTRLYTLDYTMAMFGQGVVNNDPDIFVYGRYHSSNVEPGLGNFEGFINATYDALAELQRITTNVTERQQLVLQCEAILAEELPTIVCPNQIRVTIVNTDKFEGWVNMVSQGPVSYMNKWTYLYVHLKPE